MKKNSILAVALALSTIVTLNACKPKNASNAVSGDAAEKSYVAPGKYDTY